MLSHPRAKFKAGDLIDGHILAKPENILLVIDLLDSDFYRLYSVPDGIRTEISFYLVDSCYKKIG